MVDFSIVFCMFTRGYMVDIWFIYGLYGIMGFIYGLYMVYIWFIYGLYMVYIWFIQAKNYNYGI